ncbi:hypothetical protein Hanom_Chr06g00488011 [Helianthus anomalus]
MIILSQFLSLSQTNRSVNKSLFNVKKVYISPLHILKFLCTHSLNTYLKKGNQRRRRRSEHHTTATAPPLNHRHNNTSTEIIVYGSHP